MIYDKSLNANVNISNLTFIAIIIATKSTIDITTKLLFKNPKTK